MARSAGPQAATCWGSDPEFFGPRHQARLKLLLGLLARHVAPGGRVLDVGAGTGSFVRLLDARGYAATGLEASEAFVAYALAGGLPASRFVQGNATCLPFEDGEFAAATAGEVLEHLEDDARAVSELFRVLEAGGVCVATVPADPAKWDASDDWAGHLRRYTPERLAGLFTAAGFEVLRLAHWGFPFVRLYHRLVYLPLLARKRASGDQVTGRPGRLRRLASALLGTLFTLDGWLLGAPGGIGLVIVARKP